MEPRNLELQRVSMKRSLRSWLWRVDVTREVDEEIAFHVEMRTRELIDRGVDPRIAREMVLARVGDISRLKRTCVDLGRKREREMRLIQWFGEFRADLQFRLPATGGLTGLHPGRDADAGARHRCQQRDVRSGRRRFASPVAISRSRPSCDCRRVGSTAGSTQPHRAAELSRVVAGRAATFESMAAIWIPGSGGGPAMTGPDGTPETVPAQSVTASFFDVLGVQPIAGRTFRLDDETTNPSVVVMSEGFWRRRFAADPTLIGREITLDGRPITVIGVVPSSAQFTPGLTFNPQGVSISSLWMLLPSPRIAGPENTRGQCGVCRFLQVVGRMKPGVSTDAAQSELKLLADTLAAQQGNGRPRRVLVTPLRDSMIGGDVRLTSMLLLGVVGLVLCSLLRQRGQPGAGSRYRPGT